MLWNEVIHMQKTKRVIAKVQDWLKQYSKDLKRPQKSNIV